MYYNILFLIEGNNDNNNRYSMYILRFPLGWKVYNNIWTLLNILFLLQLNNSGITSYFCMLLFMLFVTSFIC